MAILLRNSKNNVQAIQSWLEAPSPTAVAGCYICSSINKLVMTQEVPTVTGLVGDCAIFIPQLLSHITMSFPRMVRPMNLLLVVLQFLTIVSAVNIDHSRRSFDRVIIHNGAGNTERSLGNRDTGIFQPLRRPTLLVAKGNRSRYIFDLLRPREPELHSLARSVCITEF